jgi:hypothetical protein
MEEIEMDHLDKQNDEIAAMLARIGVDPSQRQDRGEFAATLTRLGFKISKQTLAKLACTGTDGPEYQLAFGRAYYVAGRGVAWAIGRLSAPRRSSLERVAA